MFPNCPTPSQKIYKFKGATYQKFFTACTIFAFKNQYLGEFEAEFQKALACEAGAQGVGIV
jgi:hypothetical protein